jgi:hypothetical protein
MDFNLEALTNRTMMTLKKLCQKEEEEEEGGGGGS